MRHLGGLRPLLLVLSCSTRIANCRPLEDDLDDSSGNRQHVFSNDNSGGFYDRNNLGDCKSNLFSSVHGLLRGWSQANAPNGWSIVPGYVPVGTHLYHGASGTSYPTSGMEWFAFDPEHAYFFAAREMGFLHTFVATAPLPVLYFDGMSASTNAPGVKDLQHIIVEGTNTSSWKDTFAAEYKRSRKLCDWVQQVGFGGVVRQEATFEILWCDFAHSVAHVRGVNISTPTKSMETVLDSSGDEDNESLQSGPSARLPLTGRGETVDPLTLRAALNLKSSPSLYFEGRAWSFLNAASTHFSLRENRVILSIPHMTSLHDPKYRSIRDQYALPNYRRRLLNISEYDVHQFKKDVVRAGASWRSGRTSFEDPDYGGIIDQMVQRKTLELQQIKTALDRANATEALLLTKVLAYGGGFFTFLEGPQTLNTGPNAAPVEEQLRNLGHSIETCARARTTDDPVLSSRNDSLRWAIESVQRRICEFEGRILMDAIKLELQEKIEEISYQHMCLVETWRKELSKLLGWLQWPTLNTCPGGCADDQICLVPMWPIDPDGGFSPLRNFPGEFTPRCVEWDLLD